MRSLTRGEEVRITDMCGRYAQSLGAEAIVEAFDLAGSTLDHSLPLSWNIAPTNEIYIIRSEADSRILDSASWGIIAPWHKKIADARASQSHAINARSESIHEKPTFRHAFRTSRCLIPATGYYEWATSLGKYPPKQPFYISSVEGKQLSIAGIWSSWQSESGEVIQSAAIITREAVGELATIHSRMPVFMPEDRWESWLDTEARDINRLVKAMVLDEPDAGLQAVPVSARVNLVANNGAELIAPIELGEPETLF
jgi:putative SOS response-associated peptidase YedK